MARHSSFQNLITFENRHRFFLLEKSALKLGWLAPLRGTEVALPAPRAFAPAAALPLDPSFESINLQTSDSPLP